MEAVTNIMLTLTVQDVETFPSRLLHPILASRQGPLRTTNAVQRSHADPPVIASDTAQRRTLFDEALLTIVLQWLVIGSTQRDDSYYTPETTHQLLNVALTCKVWFHPSTSWLWRNLENVWDLVLLLLPDNLRSVFTPQRAQYDYIWQTYYADPSNGCVHPQFLIFRYYSGLIHALQLTAGDFAFPFFSKLGRLHDANVLFPALRSITWSDRMGNIPAIALRSFGLACRAPLLTSLAISITNPNLNTPEQRLETLQKLHAQLRRAARYAPKLTALTVIGPEGVPLLTTRLHCFRMVRHVNLQINLRVPESKTWQPTAETDDDEHRLPVQTVFLSWTIETNILSILHAYQFSALTSLTVMADDHPPARFLKQVCLLGTHTPPCLKYLRIEAGIQVPILTKGPDFTTFIQPFLLCSAMEEVVILLPSLGICFHANDFQAMLKAWPTLRSLNLGFPTSRSSRQLPDLRSVIVDTPRACPNLTKLHLPGIATFKSIAPVFSLPRPSSPHRFLISSDVITIEHHPLDIAYWIAKTFAQVQNPIHRPSVTIGESWTTIYDFVDAIRQKDRLAVIKTLVASWRIPQPEWAYIVSDIQDRCLREMEL